MSARIVPENFVDEDEEFDLDDPLYAASRENCRYEQYRKGSQTWPPPDYVATVSLENEESAELFRARLAVLTKCEVSMVPTEERYLWEFTVRW